MSQGIIVCSFKENLWSKLTKNGQKPHFEPVLDPLGQPPNFFFKNLALSVTSYHGHLSSCTTLEKTRASILRKLSDRQTDGRTEGQTSTNVERPMKRSGKGEANYIWMKEVS